MRPFTIPALPQPCDWCRPAWLAWTGQTARQQQDTSTGAQAHRYAQQHARHVQTLCARLHQGVPHYQPYLCEWLDADPLDGPVGCDAQAEDGKRFCATHLAADTPAPVTGENENVAVTHLPA